MPFRRSFPCFALTGLIALLLITVGSALLTTTTAVPENAFSTGTVLLGVDPASALITFGNMAPGDIERPALLWLKSHIAGGAVPPIHLGYGRSDRFVQASQLLGAVLGEERVVTTEWAHDWPTWQTLWRMILERFPL